jgi:xylulokinase
LLPAIKPTTHVAGKICDFFVERFGFSKECEVLTFSGDNPLSLLGMGVHSIDDRKTVLSLGTSGTGFALTRMSHDPNGFGNALVSVTNPADHLMLLCFRNDSLAREAVRNRLFPGDDWTKFNNAIETSPPGNGGDFMIPFFAHEITPKTNEAVVKYFGNLNQNSPRTARAVVEAHFLNMAHFFKLLEIQTPEILVTGGASLNPSILQIGADVMNSTFCLLETAEDAAQKKPNTDSVSLGGAILSASAIGKFDIRELTTNFCAPKGARYTPNSCAAYDELRVKFAEELNRLKF